MAYVCASECFAGGGGGSSDDGRGVATAIQLAYHRHAGMPRVQFLCLILGVVAQVAVHINDKLLQKCIWLQNAGVIFAEIWHCSYSPMYAYRGG